MNSLKCALEKITNFKIFISQSKSEIKIVLLGIIAFKDQELEHMLTKCLASQGDFLNLEIASFAITH